MEKTFISPKATSGQGVIFEHKVTTSFVIFMKEKLELDFESMPRVPIKEIKSQTVNEGYATDDTYLILEDNTKILCQIKSKLAIQKTNQDFKETIIRAWEDFDNENLFNKEKDKIFIVTSLLNNKDKNFIDVLENAKQKNFLEFSRSKSNQVYAEKKQIILDILKEDKGIESEECIYNFLKLLYVIQYDLDLNVSINRLLINNLCAKYRLSFNDVRSKVEEYSKQSSTITHEKINPWFVEQKPVVFEETTIAKNLELQQPKSKKPNISKQVFSNKEINKSLIPYILIGSFSEINESDLEVIKKITKNNDEPLQILRDEYEKDSSFITFQNNIWTIKNRIEIIQKISSSIYDESFSLLKKIAKEILSEIDPKYEMPLSERIYAGIKNKTPKFSGNIRKSVAETLAIINSNILCFSNISQNKFITEDVVFFILKNKSWKSWASLDYLLPIIAESSPNTFLNMVEEELSKGKESEFIKLFPQKNNDDWLSNSNYLTDLLWSLEALAWKEEYLGKVAKILLDLSKLDNFDTNHGNRPINSLQTIFLPWLPQTQAGSSKRIEIINSLNIAELDNAIIWNLTKNLAIKSFLSNSLGCYKPKWILDIDSNYNPKVTIEEYCNEIKFYAKKSVELAKNNPNRIIKLLDRINKDDVDVFNQVLEQNTLKVDNNISEKEKSDIWSVLLKFINKHRSYSESKWSFDENSIIEIEKYLQDFEPKELLHKYKRLFNEKDFDLYKTDQWKDEEEALLNLRVNALQDIFNNGGLEKINKFIKITKEPSKIGGFLARVKGNSLDKDLLPKYLLQDDYNDFISSYIWRKNYLDSKSYKWIDSLPMNTWSQQEIIKIFFILPLEKYSWERAEKLLNQDEYNEYWRKSYISIFSDLQNIEYAINKFTEIRTAN